MSPPPFACFINPFEFGTWKIDIKESTKYCGVNLFGQRFESPRENVGYLETVFGLKIKQLTMLESIKWNWYSPITWNTSIAYQPMKNVEEEWQIGFVYTRDDSYKEVSPSIVQGAYSNKTLRLDADIELPFEDQAMTVSAVKGFQNWFAGLKSSFSGHQWQSSELFLASVNKDFLLHAITQDLEMCTVWLHLDFIKFGLELDYVVNQYLTSFAYIPGIDIGVKYKLDNSNAVRVKLTNFCQVGLGYEKRMANGMELTLSALVDFRRMSQQIGIAVSL